MFLKLGVIINWNLNQEFIAKNLCEQRKIKNNCCKGKCQLNKSLKNIEDNSPKQNKIPKKFNLTDCFIGEGDLIMIKPEQIQFTSSHLELTSSSYHFTFCAKNDRPPCI